MTARILEFFFFFFLPFVFLITCTWIGTGGGKKTFEYFLLAQYWNQKSCFSVSNAHIYNKHMLCEVIYRKHASICCVNWIALSVGGMYWMTELLGNNFSDLLDDAQVKIFLISSSR